MPEVAPVIRQILPRRVELLDSKAVLPADATRRSRSLYWASPARTTIVSSPVGGVRRWTHVRYYVGGLRRTKKIWHGSNKGNTGTVEPSATNSERKSHNG